MRITIHQTGSDADLREQRCCVCRQRFYLGPASCLLFSGCDSGRGKEVLWGEVCPACIEGGPDHIQGWLDGRARWSRMIAEQETEAAEEGITDCPTLDEVLAAESYYERPMFRTGQEYEDALSRGEVD